MLLAEGTYPQLEIYGSQLVTEEGTDKFHVYLRDPENPDDTITDFLTAKTEKSFKFACRRLASYGWDPKANGYAFSRLDAEDERNPWYDLDSGRVSYRVGPVVLESREYPPGSNKFNTQVALVGDERAMRERMPEGDAATFEMRLRQRFALGSAPPAQRKKPAGKGAAKPAPLAATGTEGRNVPADDDPY